MFDNFGSETGRRWAPSSLWAATLHSEHALDAGECAFLVAGAEPTLWRHEPACVVDVACVVKLRSLLGNFNDVLEQGSRFDNSCRVGALVVDPVK